MTVNIFVPPPGGDIAAMARAVLDRELAGFRNYCSVKRELAEKAVRDYQPAYIQTSSGNDQWGGCAVTWANGGLLGTSLDPAQPLRGLRAVLRWAATWKKPDEFTDWMRHVVRVVKPINAMAQLDMELLRTEYGLSEKETANG